MKNSAVTHAAGIFPFFSIADGGGILKLIVLFSCFVSTLSHLIVSVVIHNPACQGLWVTALTTESCPHLFGERLNLTGRSEPKKNRGQLEAESFTGETSKDDCPERNFVP